MARLIATGGLLLFERALLWMLLESDPPRRSRQGTAVPICAFDRGLSVPTATVRAVPSFLHEALVELVRDRPELAAQLLTDVFGAVLPGFATAAVESGELTETTPTEYRADVVVVLRDGSPRPVWAVIVEAQLHRDPEKRYTWRGYVGGLSARLRCQVTLLVICPDRAVAEWCTHPIDVGLPGTRLGQLVLGPDRVPKITDPVEAARTPELAVISAIAHGAMHYEVLDILPAALAAISPDRWALYSDVVLGVLPTAARLHLEALVRTGTYEYQSDFVRGYVNQGRTEGRAEGRAEGEARAVLAVLTARGIEVSPAAHERIIGCADLNQLDRWVRRAATATSIDDVLADE